MSIQRVINYILPSDGLICVCVSEVHSDNSVCERNRL
jgi:hypothetical protein